MSQKYAVGWKIEGETVTHTKICETWDDVLKIGLVGDYLGPTARDTVNNKGLYEFTNDKISVGVLREGTWPDA